MPGRDDRAAAARSPARTQVPARAGPGGRGLGPLTLNPGRLAPGLPDRDVPLDELKALLLHPATSAASRNAVRAELVRRARAGGPARVFGAAGVAMRWLRRAVAAGRACRGDVFDLRAQVLVTEPCRRSGSRGNNETGLGFNRLPNSAVARDKCRD